MKALRKTRPGPGSDMQDIPIPKPGPHDLLVRVEAAAMCKSDVEVFEWTPLVEAANYALPFTLGHEFAGEVVEVGALVKQFKPGERVAGETHIPCGVCRDCRTGNQHICRNGMGVLGRSVDGCFAEYIRLPEVSAIRLAENNSYDEGALYEPLGTAIHALQKAKPWGVNIAVLGVGTIGLMACEAAKALGAANVYALDVNPSRLEYSLKVGADMAFNGLECDFAEEIKKHCDHLDCIVDFTGSPKVINQAIDALSTAGRLVHVGMVGAELTIPSYMYRVVYRELIITGLFGRHMYTTWDILERLVKSGGVKLSNYVGAKLPLDDYEKAIERFDELNGRALLIP